VYVCRWDVLKRAALGLEDTVDIGNLDPVKSNLPAEAADIEALQARATHDFKNFA
jgi:hypothetical protein